MDRRFSNVISTLAETALELRTRLAKYWRTRTALVDQGYRPELHYMRGPARSGARPTPVCRNLIVELRVRSNSRAEYYRPEHYRHLELAVTQHAAQSSDPTPQKRCSKALRDIGWRSPGSADRFGFSYRGCGNRALRIELIDAAEKG